jgi:hypothetical protein
MDNPGQLHFPGAPSDYVGSAGNDIRPRKSRTPNPYYWQDDANGMIITTWVDAGGRADRRLKWDSSISFKRVSDGLSKTILAGEKHVPEEALGSDGAAFNGDDTSNYARVGGPTAPIALGSSDLTTCGSDGKCPPRVRCACDNFGSWHPGICHFIFADARLDELDVTIDPKVLSLLTDRADGTAIPESY